MSSCSTDKWAKVTNNTFKTMVANDYLTINRGGKIDFIHLLCVTLQVFFLLVHFFACVMDEANNY